METIQLDTAQNQGLDIESIRQEFPMLQYQKDGRQLIYFDSAATSHKPQRVLDRLNRFYAAEYSKPKESHTLSQLATKNMEDARAKVAAFIGASSPDEIVFSRGCTEALNMVAGGFEKGLLQKGDEIVITELEHHANIVPWQMACQQTGAKLRVVPITDSGEVNMDAYQNTLTRHTRIVAFSHSSHVLGTILPVKEMVTIAHERSIPVLVDGAQAAPHMPVNMQELDCDFYTFSGHKMGTPSGVGVLYAKQGWFDKLPPYEGGGDMTKTVSFEKPEFAEGYQKFEAGTMPFAEIIAFGTLIDYVQQLDMHKTAAYEQELLEYATQKLSQIEHLTIYGTAPEKEPVLSFAIGKLDLKGLEQFLNNEYNIVVRAGTLTADPLMKRLKVPSLLRVSFCYYNTHAEVDILANAIETYVKQEIGK